MSEMKSEFVFGFVNDNGSFKDLPLEYGKFICETVNFDSATFKSKKVLEHEVIKLEPQSSQFYADSWLGQA